MRRWFDRDVAAVKPTPRRVDLGLRPFSAHARRRLAAEAGGGRLAARELLVCGGDAKFAAWNGSDRRLVCGRCAAQWPFNPARCPHCLDASEASRQSFSEPSRMYRVEACTRCRRYVKGWTKKRDGRSVLVAYDPIATIPLDAAAAQLGFE